MEGSRRDRDGGDGEGDLRGGGGELDAEAKKPIPMFSKRSSELALFSSPGNALEGGDLLLPEFDFSATFFSTSSTVETGR